MGGSESNHLAEVVGPRCVYRRDYTIRWRCLTDVSDDGAVFVLSNVCFQNSVEKIVDFLCLSYLAGGSGTEVPGEWLVANVLFVWCLNTGETLSTFVVTFYYKMSSRKTRCSAVYSVR